MKYATLNGKRVAFLLTHGVEQVELTSPWEAVQQAGATPVLVSPAVATVQAFDGTVPADSFAVEMVPRAVRVEEFTALVLPGGVLNADNLRLDEASVDLVRSFFDHGKTIAAICHAPWMLVEAGVLGGRVVTSYPSLRTDITNAGAEWVDTEVVVDSGLVTSRTPADLPAFNAKFIEEIAIIGSGH